MTQDDLHCIGLLNAIQELHMNMNGSSDTLNYNEFTEEDYYQVLLERFNLWKDKPDMYSNCIKLLLNSVLTEYEQSRK